MRTEYLLSTEIGHVLALLTPSNRLVMRVSLHTGLRVGDVVALRPDDLKPRAWVVERKTGKRRQVGFPAPLLRDLRAECGTYWVFPGRNDERKHRSRQAVWADVKRAAKACRLPQNVGPHSARKVYAVQLMHRYGDLGTVQRAMRHSSPEITMIYAMADQMLAQKHKRRRGKA